MRNILKTVINFKIDKTLISGNSSLTHMIRKIQENLIKKIEFFQTLFQWFFNHHLKLKEDTDGDSSIT